MPKEPELITCPNPECGRKIGVVSDVSTTPVKRFHACPHCFFELDVISAEFLRKEGMRLHVEEEKKRKEGKVLQSALIILGTWQVFRKINLSCKNA